MKHYCLLLLMLLILAPATAQDQAPLPVLNAEDIFAEGVTVLERLPVLEMDWRASQIKYYNPNAEEWERYDFPEDVALRGYEERSDGTYLVFERGEAPTHDYYAGDGHVWIFDPVAGAIEQPEQICNLVRALPNEGRWFFTKIDDNYYLCNNETGQLSPPLNRDFGECILTQYSGYLGISPDGSWVIFKNCFDDEPLDAFTAHAFFIFAYDTIDDKIYSLGLTDYSQSGFISWWRDDGTVIFSTGSDSFDGNWQYVIRNVPEFVNARRIYYEISLGERPSMQRLFEINASYPSGYDQKLFWLEQDTIPHPIYSYDFNTQETALVTTLDGCPYPIECYFLWNNDKTLGVIAIALESPDFTPLYIYDKRTETWAVKDELAIVLKVEDERIFLFSGYEETYLQSIDLNTFEVTTYGTVTTRMYDPFNYLSPDSRFIMVRDWNNEIPLGVYDIELNAVYPVLTNTTIEDRHIHYQFEWIDDNTIHINAVHDNPNISLPDWHIRIDALNEEQS